MKKRVLSTLLVLSVATTLFTGCGKAENDNVIKVGATPTPHAEILRVIEDDLLEKGYTLEVVEYNDYIIPNTATESGELDANYFQHQPYLDDFNAENDTHLVSVAGVHFEPFGIYAGKTTNLADLQEGAVVAVPNDTTNEARALLLLEAQGLITLKEDAGMTATVADIVENPLNLEIKELEAAQVARTVSDVDIACINGNYAAEAGFTVNDALATESVDSLAAQTYVNIVVVKEGNENSEKTKALVEAILSDEVKEYINAQYDGGVVPTF
ncbi:MAG: MetQ/NlpA family ABC transporter substrate-binding protein [Lachnospiraceae bacterium]|nr:MetQ/NlpA family ABC transporter substrate-binding protein [Lachnospiraceae bacterium]